MEEMPSKTADPKVPLGEQEFYELSLSDEANELGTRYCVRQQRQHCRARQWTHYADRRIMPRSLLCGPCCLMSDFH